MSTIYMSQIEKDRELEIKILEGKEAISYLEKPTFLKKWSGLLKIFKYSSIFQDPSFVLPWYKNNVNEFSAVILVSYSGEKLVGLLTLAKKICSNSRKYENKLFGTGEFFGIYQTWLVAEEYQNSFWKYGIIQIFKKFPGCSIYLKYLSKDEISQNLKKIPGFRNITVLEKFKNPILDFKLKDYDRLLAKRHFKSKYNRLNRAGEIVFERVNSSEEIDIVFNDIEVFMNLRHGAMFNKIPFPKELNQRMLFLEWFENGILHVTTLRLDGELIGAIILIIDYDNSVHLAGLTTYSPFYAKFSPGLVHLYLLVNMLKEESFQNLKLSPGNDNYKERFSNSYEELYGLLISKSPIKRLRRKVKIKLSRFYLKFGVRPIDVHVWISKKKAVINNLMSKWIIKRKMIGFNSEILIEKLLKILSENPNDVKVELESKGLDSLLLFEDGTFGVSRWKFLEETLKRLEENQKFLTFCNEDTLLVCVWYKGHINKLEELYEINKSGDISKIYVSRYFKF